MERDENYHGGTRRAEEEREGERTEPQRTQRTQRGTRTNTEERRNGRHTEEWREGGSRRREGEPMLLGGRRLKSRLEGVPPRSPPSRTGERAARVAPPSPPRPPLSPLRCLRSSVFVLSFSASSAVQFSVPRSASNQARFMAMAPAGVGWMPSGSR